MVGRAAAGRSAGAPETSDPSAGDGVRAEAGVVGEVAAARPAAGAGLESVPAALGPTVPATHAPGAVGVGAIETAAGVDGKTGVLNADASPAAAAAPSGDDREPPDAAGVAAVGTGTAAWAVGPAVPGAPAEIETVPHCALRPMGPQGRAPTLGRRQEPLR